MTNEAKQYQDLVSRKPTAYLYSRVSDIRQDDKDKSGIARQIGSQDVNNLLKEFNNMPQVWMNDAGLSAHHGHNISKGIMGDFISACEEGDIAEGSILIIEYIDRLTRIPLTDANYLANTILKAGVSIHVWGSNDVIVKNDLTSTIKLVLELQGANAYTQKLSGRVINTAITRMNKALDGIKDADGHTYAVNGYGSNVWWCDTTSNYVKPHDYYWPIAREIIELVLDGLGWMKIIKFLKENDYKPPGAFSKKESVRNKAMERGWGQNMISGLSRKTALLGIKEFKNLEITIPNYYPPLCTPDEFLRMADIKKTKQTGGVKVYAALFSGKAKTRCGFCNGTLHTSPNKGGQKLETRNYKCSNPECIAGTVDSVYFETALIKTVGVIISQPPKQENRFKERELELQINQINKVIYNFNEAIAISKHNVVKLTQQQDIQIEKKMKLEIELFELKSQPVVDPLTINSIPSNIIDYTNTKERIKFRDLFFHHIKEIRAKINKRHNTFNNQNILSFAIELYSGHVIKSNLYGNQFLEFDGKFTDEMHSSDDNGGVLAYYNSHCWHGIDQKGRKISFLNDQFDSYTAKERDKIDHIKALAVKRTLEGEDLIVD
ncbi:MAG: hypothetical protein ACI9YH_004724 [Colwellia sp.]|jgi:hypothetical protein